MEVVVPLQDFHFNSTPTTPYMSAPSSPKRFGDPLNHYCHYASAPTSPTTRLAAAAIYGNLTTAGDDHDHSTATGDGDDDVNFAFDFSGQMHKGGIPPELTAADELFEEGKIRPLKPPPGGLASSPRSPATSPRSRALWSPRGGRVGTQELDPFTAAMMEVTRERGRERNNNIDPFSYSSSSSRSRKGSRSLSPLRGGGGGGTTSSATSAAPVKNSTGWAKKWRLRDLFLFRSASEGRAAGNRSKDPLRKYTVPTSASSLSSSMLPPSANKRGGEAEDYPRGSGAAISASYAANRAAALEVLKKKTPLPHRQGLFGINWGLSTHSFNRKSS